MRKPLEENSLIQDLFEIADFPSRICCDFFRTVFFQRSYFFTIFQSNCFDETVTFSEQLFLQNNCFFKVLLFKNNHFFAAVIFSEQLLFQSENSIKQPLLVNGKLFRAVTFRSSYLFGGGTVQKVLLHSINVFKKAIFQKKIIFQKSNMPYYLPFLESCLFRAATFSKDATFYSNSLFRRAAFLQFAFSKE